MTDLVNRGLIILNGLEEGGEKEPPHESTIIVTGVARGGTSMVAQTLDRLGLYLGDSHDAVVVEDTEILRALQNSDLNRLDGIIANRNQRFAKWGFKIPNLHDFLPAAEQRRFRNPRYVVVFRDPLAIARRNELSMRHDAAKAIREAGENITKLTSYVCALSAPALLVSYEKALQDGNLLIDTLSRFCGLAPRDEQVTAALATIIPNENNYIRATQVAQPFCRGTIDKIRGNTLEGWCCYRDSPEVVQIELCAEGEVVGLFSAQDYREDLALAGIGNGHHAFNIDLTPFNVGSATVISVRPVRDTLFLPNSGRTVEDLRRRSQL